MPGGPPLWPWIQTLVLILGFGIATVVVAGGLEDLVQAPREVALAVAFALVVSGCGVAVVGTVLASKLIALFIERRARRLEPGIRAVLSAYALGGDAKQADEVCIRDRRYAERVLVALLATLTGDAHGRLVALAEWTGLVARWVRQAKSRRAPVRLYAVSRLAMTPTPDVQPALIGALEDSFADVRDAAATGLARSGDLVAVERAFAFATTHRLLSRIIVGDALRPHARALRERAIPSALRSDDPRQVLATLEMTEAWRLGLPYEWVAPLLEHDNVTVRARALRRLPRVSQPQGAERIVGEALADDDDVVRAAAAFAVGRLRWTHLVPPLTSCLQRGGLHGPLSAAYALAECGKPGLAALETATRAEDSVTAGVALEALERVRIGRLRSRVS